jgi:hypothetical protein
MQLSQLISALEQQPESAIRIRLPDGSFVPDHFHITEVGRIQKDFIDCGGTVRSQTTCLLQVWVAHDLDHRLQSTKLASILRLSVPLFQTLDLSVEIEYEQQVISQYQLQQVEPLSTGICFQLGSKHTACLAPDRCGVGESSCCSPTNVSTTPTLIQLG